MTLALKFLILSLTFLAFSEKVKSADFGCSTPCWAKPLADIYEFGNDAQRRVVDFLNFVRNRRITYNRGIAYLLGYAG